MDLSPGTRRAIRNLFSNAGEPHAPTRGPSGETLPVCRYCARVRKAHNKIVGNAQTPGDAHPWEPT